MRIDIESFAFVSGETNPDFRVLPYCPKTEDKQMTLEPTNELIRVR